MIHFLLKQTYYQTFDLPNGESLRDLTPDNLVDLLIDRFKNMFLDQKERELFMKQVVNDWINDKITVNGILTVNRLK